MEDNIPGSCNQLQGFDSLQFSNNWSGSPADSPGEIGNSTGITMSSSVLGIRFKTGVLVAADTLVTYGSLARYQNIDRVFKINNSTVLGGSGDYADIQNLKHSIDTRIVEDLCRSDGFSMQPSELSSWITRVLYSRRTTMKPLYVDMVVGGIEKTRQPFLSGIDMRGCAYQNYAVATGMARHLALPLIHEQKPREREFDFSEACKLIQDCMRILYYRDTRSIPQYMVCICTNEECSVKGPFKVEENWTFANKVQGY